MFSCEFCEISKNTFFTEHLWASASDFRVTTFAILMQNLDVLLWKHTVFGNNEIRHDQILKEISLNETVPVTFITKLLI